MKKSGGETAAAPRWKKNKLVKSIQELEMENQI